MTDFSHYSAYYPFVISLPVTSEAGTPDLAFVGAGGGVFVLDVSDETDPKPWTGGPPIGLRAPGLCRRVVLGPDQTVYLAMGKGGTATFSRVGWGQTLAIPSQGDARAVDVAPTGTPGEHLIIVGSYESTGGGRLELYLSSQPMTPLDSKLFPQGVEVVRVSQALSPGNTTVLVGLACGGVLRYDIPVSGPYAFGAQAASWTAGSVFVRDIAIDEIHARAFVAGFSKGVFALDLQTGLTPQGAPWPIQATVGGSRLYSTGVALDAGRNRLVVGLGAGINVEAKTHGCDVPISCDGAQGTPVETGIRVFDVSTLASPQEEAALLSSSGLPFEAAPFGVAIRSASDSLYHVDVAGRGSGYVTLRGEFVSLAGEWQLSQQGLHDIDDGVPLHSPDDAYIQGSYLYIACEASLATFDLNATSLLESPADVKKVQCLISSGFASPDARLYTRGSTGPGQRKFGIYIYDVETSPDAPIQGSGILDAGGDGFFLRAVPGISTTHDPSPRWLYTSNRTDDDAIDEDPNAPGPFTGGLRVISVGTATDADDPGITTMGIYVHEAGGGPAGLFGFDVRDIVDEGVPKHVVYAAYSHKTAQTVGLAAITIQRVTGGPMQLRLTLVAEVPAAKATPAGAEGLIAYPAAPGGQVLYDASSQRVFAALGCNGMAVFDVSSPLAPSLIAHRYPVSAGTSTTWQVLRGQGTKAYLSTLNHGIGVMDDYQSFATSPISFYPTRSQGVGIAIDPTNAQRVYIAEGSVGMGLVDLSSPPA